MYSGHSAAVEDGDGPDVLLPLFRRRAVIVVLNSSKSCKYIQAPPHQALVFFNSYNTNPNTNSTIRVTHEASEAKEGMGNIEREK